MRYLLIIAIIYLLYLAKIKLFPRPPEVIKTASKGFDIQPILDELMMCGELAQVVHLEDKAGYGFIPLLEGLFRPSLAELSYMEMAALDPKELAHKVISQWNKNDEIALNAKAFSKSYVVKDGEIMPLLRSIKWIDKL